ncbi:MAG TPA: hypothetical protein PLV92_20335, partial [Pirellulaceae bacterium]|nr:hypothetical protein [Pirellulaceae bacterium]
KPLIVRAARPTTQSLAALKTLGFNTVQLNAPPTPEILAEAGRLDLWLIAPPPATMLQDDESDDAAPSANRALGSASSSRASSPTPLESSLTPPPSRSKAFDGVLAWNLGDCLTAQHVAPAKRLAANLRRADRDAGRPVLADVEAGFEQHSRCFDMIVARCWNPRREPDTGEAQLAGDARVAGGTPAAGAIADAMSRLRPGVPVWAALAVPAPFATLDTPILDDRTLADELRHLRQAMYEAIADGARGFVFHLPDDFDPVGPESRDIAGSLQALNAELQLIEPWLAGGAGVEPLVMDSPDWRACVLSTQRARLVVLRRIEPTARGRGSDGRSSHEGRNQNDGRGENDNPIRRASFSSPGSAASTASTASPTSPGRSPTGLSSPIKPTKIGWKPTQLPPKPLVFVDNGATSSVEAYEIDSADLRPVRHQRTAGGVQVTLEQAAPISLVVLTQEPLVVNYLARTLNDRRQAITKGR